MEHLSSFTQSELTKFDHICIVNGSEFPSPSVSNDPNQFSSFYVSGFSGVDASKNHETSAETVEAGTVIITPDRNEVVVSQANDLTVVKRRQTKSCAVNKYNQQKARTYATRNLSKQQIESVMTQGLTLRAAAELLKVAPSTLKRYKKKFSLGDWPKCNRKLCNPDFGSANAPSESNSGISELSTDDGLSANQDEVVVVPQQLQSHFPAVQPVHCPSFNDELILVSMKKSSLHQLVECGHISKPTSTNYVEAQIQTAFHSSAMDLQYHSSELSQQEFCGDVFSQQQQPLSMDYAQVEAQLQTGEAPASGLFGSLPMNWQDYSAAPTQPGNFSYAPGKYLAETFPQQQQDLPLDYSQVQPQWQIREALDETSSQNYIFASALPSDSICSFDQTDRCYNILWKDTLTFDDVTNFSTTMEVANHFENNNTLSCDLS